ncbi:MAG: hypothetical protein E7612_02345 [Ruminococcaceae bacterium]|nr:hypothetical protein [Oscillospiraceae bacterium]
MYTRSYYADDEKLSVPENYDGYAFSEEKNEEKRADETEIQEQKAQLKAPWDVSPHEHEKITDEVMSKPKVSDGFFNTLMGKLPFGNFFENISFFKNGRVDFGTEELLIIGIALFLLLSKNGDLECSVILLFLLFVK